MDKNERLKTLLCNTLDLHCETAETFKTNERFIAHTLSQLGTSKKELKELGIIFDVDKNDDIVLDTFSE